MWPASTKLPQLFILLLLLLDPPQHPSNHHQLWGGWVGGAAVYHAALRGVLTLLRSRRGWCRDTSWLSSTGADKLRPPTNTQVVQAEYRSNWACGCNPGDFQSSAFKQTRLPSELCLLLVFLALSLLQVTGCLKSLECVLFVLELSSF